MARGWESKQVEDQQAESLRRRETAGRRALTPEQQAVQQREDTLRLAAARTRSAIDASRSEAHRAMLRMQLEAIENEIGALDRPSARR